MPPSLSPKPRRWTVAFWLAFGSACHAAPPPTPPAPAAPPQPVASCAAGDTRPDYVSLRADTPSALAAQVAACERLGYRRIGGVARALIANPGAASAEWYYQVMIVPAGAPSAGASAASTPAAAAR